MESWKSIPGYEGKYEVSDLGRVRSLNYRGKAGLVQVLRVTINKHGYPVVGLYGEKSKTCSVHRLVALAWLPNPEGLPEVDHINTIRTDARAENLRWCTKAQNWQNEKTRENLEKAHERLRGKKKKPLSRLRPSVLQYKEEGHSRELIFVARYKNPDEAAVALGVNTSSISYACNGSGRRCHGFILEYGPSM